jgi:hypothetical protein
MKIVTEIANRVSLNIAKMNGKDAADPRQRSYYLGVANNLEKLNWKKPTTRIPTTATTQNNMEDEEV